ncbi:MAG: glycosyltransferase family A protein [Caldilineaceae bacterium]
MFCSAVIPTIDRTSLSRAVESVLHQSLKPTDYEIIVVNDSGRPLHHRDWMKCNNVKIIDTNCRNRSVARNAGAAMAKGDYLHFLDDDDWITPESYQGARSVRTHRRSLVDRWYRLTDNAGNKRKDVFPCENGNCLVQTIAAGGFPCRLL